MGREECVMGLIFALQPDLRRSKPEILVLTSTKKRFGLGGSFIFGGLLLGTMFLAALPLFRIFWTQGGFFDKLLTLGIATPILLYPLFAIGCWFYEERVTLKKNSDGTLTIYAAEKLFGLEWNRRELNQVQLSEIAPLNWKDSLNIAAIEAGAVGKVDRYGTKGHWMLQSRDVTLERRAKKEEIEILLEQIKRFFAPRPATTDSATT